MTRRPWLQKALKIALVLHCAVQQKQYVTLHSRKFILTTCYLFTWIVIKLASSLYWRPFFILALIYLFCRRIDNKISRHKDLTGDVLLLHCHAVHSRFTILLSAHPYVTSWLGWWTDCRLNLITFCPVADRVPLAVSYVCVNFFSVVEKWVFVFDVWAGAPHMIVVHETPGQPAKRWYDVSTEQWSLGERAHFISLALYYSQRFAFLLSASCNLCKLNTWRWHN